ncbi:uncharacterized protein LOC62_01G001693 [Vanrija pseudolonga]|uniref:SCP domain-containing protein n=1 Tax=Vanrija pseudolonga TaxID=143232 RepID=A0AAF0Y1F2_9TREE|nr:hypothetical protein LOC62_01G001693 [Vanrija pseudolonga]
MKLAPVILLALVSAVTAAPAPAKCRPKQHPVGAGGGGAQPSGAGTDKSGPTGSSPSNSTDTTTANVVANNPTGGAYPPPPVVNQTFFTDPKVTPALPPIIGHHPNVTGIVAPPGSVGVNPSGGIPADDPLAKLMIERINQWRSIYQAPPMHWNQTVSGYAVEYAKRCEFKHFLGDGKIFLNGEVLIGGGDIKDADLSWGVKRWVDAWMTEGGTGPQQQGRHETPLTVNRELTDPLPKIEVGCGWQECGKIYCDTWRYGWPDEHYPQYTVRVPPQIEVPWKEYEDPLAS